MQSKNYSIIGTHQPFVDGLMKASGAALYTADIVMPRMLFGKVLGSPHPHARVIHINAGKALALRGVKAVVTGKDIPGEKYGSFESRRDETGLTLKARYIGDAVAAVAAVDEETAAEALDLIQVEYEVLPAVFDPEEAMKEGAPLLHDEYERNIMIVRKMDFGDVEAGFKKSDYVREDRFFSQTVSHAPLEPRAVVASYDPSGKLTVWSSVQAPYGTRRWLSVVLGMAASKIHVIKPCVGGGFGGKMDLQPLHVAASLLSMKTGRPVKICLTREEEMSTTRVRAAMSMSVKTGVKKDGTIQAQFVKCLADSGAYAGSGVMMMYNSGLSCLIPYRIPNFKYEGHMVYTNKTVSSAMRGHGANQPRFAVESQLDMIARDLHIDPAELRLRNATQAGDTSISGLVFDSCELSKAIRESTRHAEWEGKQTGKEEGLGIGIACSGYPCGARGGHHTASGTFIQINDDGGVTVSTGSSDIGQGSRTVVAQVAAEELGIPLADITVISGDTEVTPIDPGTVSSRVTFYAGNATLIAARDVKAQLAQIAGILLHSDPEQMVFKDKKVFPKDNPGLSIPFSELATKAEGLGYGRLIIGRGEWSPTNTQFPDKKTQYGNPCPAYSFAAKVVEVKVDRETGEIDLTDFTVGDDCGQVINQLGVEGQAQGSVAMGIGHALMEEIVFDRNGQVMNPTFLDYKLPTTLDTIDTTLLEVGSPDPTGPYGAKEIGEGLLVSTVPAICNAVYDATGVRVTELPLSPEKILNGLEQKKKKSS